MPSGQLTDSWQQGNAYERYVGRWSRLVAREFLGWLNLPPALRWLDVGCGTGALTAEIAGRCSPSELIGVEPSEGFLATARTQLEGVATFHLAEASAMPLRDEAADVVVSGLALNFFPDVAAGLAEMRRVARRGAPIAAYVWDYGGRMELMRIFWDAAVELSASARQYDEGNRFPLCKPEALREAFGNAGLAENEVKPIDVGTHFRDFDDYWTPFLGGQGPAPTYVMSLDQTSRGRLRDLVLARLPRQPDGSISLVARAWAVRGRVRS